MSQTIKLSSPFVAHEKRTDEIVLKEPSGGLYTQLGEPRIAVINATGSAYWVEQPTVISAYFDKLIDHELGSVVLNFVSLEDAMALKEALFDFFTRAAAKLAARRSTTSSSARAS